MNSERDNGTGPDYLRLFEAAPALYLVLTDKLIIANASDSYLAATKTRREDIIGKHVWEVFPENPEEVAANGTSNIGASFERVLKLKAEDPVAVQKFDIPKPDAEGGGYEVRYWSIVNSPVLDDAGNVIYIINRVEDVTEFVRLKQFEREQAQATEELKSHAARMESEVFVRAQQIQETNQKLRLANIDLDEKGKQMGLLFDRLTALDKLKTEFFANVSHELRTPLTLVLGPVEMLLNDAKTPETVKHELKSIERNARLLLKQVNDLLDMAKLEAKKMDLQYAEIDLAKFVRRTAAHFESLALERRISYGIETPDSLNAQVDEDKLERVVLNLLSNAFKFTPEKGSISCSLGMQNGRAILRVGDSGPGIPANQREAVFERFHQVEGGEGRRFGGTGLGLAIAKDFVGLHKGTIEAGEAREGGALFKVELPLQAPEGTLVSAEGADHKRSAGPAALEEFSTPHAAPTREHTQHTDAPTALIVEDNAEMNQYVCSIFAETFNVISARNGKEGLEAALRHQPDIILTDLMMPEMTGPEMIRAIREHHELDDTAIIMLSAKADDDVRLKMLREGAQDYVMKPFSQEELLTRALNLVGFKKSREMVEAVNLQLTAAYQELESFSYSVSHDLQSPLRGIDGFSDLLLRQYTDKLDDRGKRYLENVRASAKFMAQLIEGLLNLSRVTRSEMRFEAVDLSKIAETLAGDLRGSAPERKVEFHIAKGLTATGDPGLLRVVMQNFFANAWKYTGKHEKATIEFGTTQIKNRTAYFVRDDGAGFDKQYAEKLFGAFLRLHAESDFPGTGIGLATVQRIVRRHGGEVWADAEVEKGATFYFTLGEKAAR
jgi:signal transduction histidine kinase